jgi:hypothetical protein
MDAGSKIDLKGSISISHYSEIRAWCTHLGCTEVELAEALAVVGPSPEVVRAFLANPAAMARSTLIFGHAANRARAGAASAASQRPGKVGVDVRVAPSFDSPTGS